MFAVIRVRGKAGTRKDLEDTLKMLRLKSVNHCVLVPETDDYLGMLRKAKDYITWGTIDKQTLSELLGKRGEIIGGKLDGDFLKEKNFKNFDELAESLIKKKVKLKDLKKIKPVFRLNPPKKGYKPIRLPYPRGALGNRKDKINDLIKRMI